MSGRAKSTETGNSGARAVDHLVLPVESLNVARARLSALGFTVAPEARHPFGTKNACVFFRDQTCIEPLAVAQRETCEAQARRGNVFVARDQAYRFRHGQEGFSAIAFLTGDAKADHAAFAKAGLSAGKMLSFSRAFDDGQGSGKQISFKLAYAADLRAPDALFFTCERVNVLAMDTEQLQEHANGALRIATVVMSETNPADFQYLLQDVVRQRDVTAHSFGMDIAAANAKLTVLNADGMRAWFGDKGCIMARGLKLRAIVFAVKSVPALRKLFAGARIGFREIAGRLVVDPAPGQGAIFAFEGGK